MSIEWHFIKASKLKVRTLQSSSNTNVNNKKTNADSVIVTLEGDFAPLKAVTELDYDHDCDLNTGHCNEATLDQTGTNEPSGLSQPKSWAEIAVEERKSHF